eukprot:TRINITY_DN4719_c0_g1_i1.p1 TRINITY_DN4719_c0_g1~~TRINITY_DN4719_c0_g1_i1.p1  ORF type:complete len:1074 (+),score=312.65 TRINITY_DN4719_c0_g1_i1:45-3224(+)
MRWAALALVWLPGGALSDTAWWEWWGSHEGCVQGSETDSSREAEFARAGRCYPVSDFTSGDPFRAVSLALVPGSLESGGVRFSCTGSDQDDGVAVLSVSEKGCPQDTGNGTAADAVVRISTDSCPIFPRGSTHWLTLKNASMVPVLAPTVASLLNKTRMHCTVCSWAFFDENEPPYGIMAAGVFVFLLISLGLNLSMRQRLDALVREKQRICPLLFGPPRPRRARDLTVRPGCMVWLSPAETEARRRRQPRRRKTPTPTPTPMPVDLQPKLSSVSTNARPTFRPRRRSDAARIAAELLGSESVSRVSSAESFLPGNRGLAAAGSVARPPLLDPADPRTAAASGPRPFRSDLMEVVSTLSRPAGRGIGVRGWTERERARGRVRGGALAEPLLGGTDAVPEYREHAVQAGYFGEDVVPGYRECGAADDSDRKHGPQATRFPAEVPDDLADVEGPSRLDLPPPLQHGPPGASLGAAHVEGALTQWLLARDAEEAEAEEFVARKLAAAGRPSRGAAPDPEDKPTIAERVAGNVMIMWPRKEEDAILPPAPVRHCVVCGWTESPSHRLELREQGWKSVGKGKSDTCIGRGANRRLQTPNIPDGWNDVKAQTWALEGQFGQFGDVVAMREANSHFTKEPVRMREALVVFKEPRAWLSREAVRRLGDHRKTRHLPGVSLEHVQPPRLYVSKEKETFWEQLCTTIGFHQLPVESDNVQWVAIQLHDDVAVWLPAISLTKVGDFWLDFVRVGPVEEVRNAAFTSWEEWWADFTICVGAVREIRRVVKGEEARFHVTVDFEGSATITLPAETLWQCTSDEYDRESLMVPQSIPDRVMLAVFVAHPILLGVKAVFLTCYFFYSITQVAKPGHGGSLGRRSGWDAYEEVYFRLFNSGYPTLMADFGALFIYRVAMQENTLGKLLATTSKPVLACVGISIAISVPGILTHCLPMYFAYGWLWIPLNVVALRVMRQLKKCAPRRPDSDPGKLYDRQHWYRHHRSYLFWTSAFYVTYRFTAELAAVIVLQTNFNYGVLMYDGRCSYTQVIPEEYEMRKTSCVLEDAYKLATLLW